MNTVIAPRMKVWTPIRPRTRRRSGCAFTERTPASVRASAPSVSATSSSGVGSGCTRAMRYPAQAEARAATASTWAGPPVASRTALMTRTGQGRGGVEGPSHDVGARQLRRGVAQRGQERGVDRAEEHRGDRRHGDQRVDRQGGPVDEHRPPGQCDRDRPDHRDRHQHLLAGPAVGVLGGQGRHDGSGQHPDESDQADLLGAAPVVGVDREHHGDGPLGGPRPEEGGLRAPELGVAPVGDEGTGGGVQPRRLHARGRSRRHRRRVATPPTASREGARRQAAGSSGSRHPARADTMRR